MRSRADDAGVKSLLIMVDDEGELGHPDADKTKKGGRKSPEMVRRCKIAELPFYTRQCIWPGRP